MKKILMVDDSELILRIGALFLKATGHQVLMARSGQEALKMATEERPDLILMDFNLPDATGCEMKQQLANDDRTRAIPVVMVTTDCQVRQFGSTVDYLLKPFDSPGLLRKVHDYLH
jgi:CheY-like chemotaxis protein